MEKIYFNIVFYVNNEHSYANAKKSKFENYYKNMINVFKTIRINQVRECVKLVLCTNKCIPDKFKNTFDSLGVEVVIIKNNHIPPNAYSSMWQGTFFYLDSISYFKNILEPNDILIIIDPDCLIVGDFEYIINMTKEEEIVNYKIEYPFEYCQNGLSRKQMKKIIMDEDGIDVNPSFFGGEFYSFKGTKIKEISYELEKAWQMSLTRFHNNKDYFKTEEHIFTYIFYKMSYNRGNANKFLKRIWTSPVYNNVIQSDINYIIWHLPAEKERGLIKIYNILCSKEDIKNINIKKLFGKILGIPKRSINRYVYDKIYCLIKKMLR